MILRNYYLVWIWFYQTLPGFLFTKNHCVSGSDRFPPACTAQGGLPALPILDSLQQSRAFAREKAPQWLRHHRDLNEAGKAKATVTSNFKQPDHRERKPRAKHTDWPRGLRLPACIHGAGGWTLDTDSALKMLRCSLSVSFFITHIHIAIKVCFFMQWVWMHSRHQDNLL